MNLSIHSETVEGHSILYLQGEVDAYTAPLLSERITPLVMNPEVSKVTVDLAQATYMDSTGIGVFIGALKAAKKSECELLIQNVPPRIERLFTITGLCRLVSVVPLKGEEAQ